MKLFVVYLLIIIHICCGLIKPNIFKTTTGKIVFVNRGIVHDLPNSQTIHELGFTETDATPISDDILSMLTIGEAIPSLIPSNQWPDELMRVKIDKIAALDDTPYWIESHFLPGHSKDVGAYNPAFVKIIKNKILMCWRTSTKYSQLKFGWYHFNNHSVTEDSRMKVESLWLSGKLSPMEDGRLIALHEGAFASVFTGLNGNDKDAVQIMAYGTYNSTLGYVEFNKGNHTTQYLNYPDIQKNWVPFMYGNHLLFFQSMNPVHVVKVTKHAAGDNNNENFAIVETFSKVRKVDLPWNETQYGKHVRGGTPAIHLKGKLFALFHTQLQFIKQWATYFMGAITYCPHPPFKIHSISRYPILKKNLYEGAWANDKYTNYVLFPMGLVPDDYGENIWVSMGYQDKDGYVVKFNVDGLLNSMEIVSNCSVSGHEVAAAKDAAIVAKLKAEHALKEAQKLAQEAKEAEDQAHAFDAALADQH